jgi:hypothetical protein
MTVLITFNGGHIIVGANRHDANGAIVQKPKFWIRRRVQRPGGVHRSCMRACMYAREHTSHKINSANPNKSPNPTKGSNTTRPKVYLPFSNNTITRTQVLHHGNILAAGIMSVDKFDGLRGQHKVWIESLQLRVIPSANGSVHDFNLKYVTCASHTQRREGTTVQRDKEREKESMTQERYQSHRIHSERGVFGNINATLYSDARQIADRYNRIGRLRKCTGEYSACPSSPSHRLFLESAESSNKR